MALPGVLGQEVVVALLQIGAHIEGGHVLGQVQLVYAVHPAVRWGYARNVIFGFALVVTHGRQAEGEACARLVHAAHPLVYVQLEVATVGPGRAAVHVAVVPVVALLSGYELEAHALEGLECQARTTQRVVYAQ